MMKIALTVVALAVGSCVGFAQSTPQADIKETDNAVHALRFDRMSNRPDVEEARQSLSVYELPETVHEQLKYSELAAHTIISITEVQPLFGSGAPLQYELLLQANQELSPAAPDVIVRFDEYGELLSQKEVPTLAKAEE